MNDGDAEPGVSADLSENGSLINNSAEGTATLDRHHGEIGVAQASG